MEISKKTLNTSQRPGNLPDGNGAHYSVLLLEKAHADTDTVLKELGICFMVNLIFKETT
jgi:hypothetical protein